MIARRLVPALVLTLPLLVGAQAPRARWAPQERDEPPYVRVWLPGASTFHYGEPVQVSFEVSEASHVAVFRVDSDGRLVVLWPQRNSLQTAARPGVEYRIRSPYSSVAAFNADYSFGGGMVIAIASYDPIDLTAFRRYRNDATYYRNVYSQRPYIGGVGHIVDRIAQETLYSDETEYDYDVAFYNVAARSFYSSASCPLSLFSGRHYRTAYVNWVTGSRYGYWDDCYSGYYTLYLFGCSSWSVLSSGYVHCRNYWDHNWPVPPVAGPQQPEPPKVNITMIDSMISRPVERYPLLDRNPEPTTTNGTTRIVTMEPVRDGPNVTRWMSDNENDAISIPHLRRGSEDLRDQSRVGRVSSRDEGFVRPPGTGIRVDEPRPGNAPDRFGGLTTMPPVREPPREPVWRDDRGGTMVTPRSDRPVPSTTIDRGTTTTGTAPSSGATSSPPPSPPPSPPAAKVTETKSSDAKGQAERKPPQ